MKYAISRFKYEQNEMAYKIYISDTLFNQSQNQRLTARYVDLIDQHKHMRIDTRSGDEIVIDVISSIGLKFKD